MYNFSIDKIFQKLKEAENLDLSRNFRLLCYVPEVIRTPDLPLRSSLESLLSLSK